MIPTQDNEIPDDWAYNIVLGEQRGEKEYSPDKSPQNSWRYGSGFFLKVTRHKTE